MLRLELAALDHGELLLADAREQLARGLVSRVALGELAADGEVEHLRFELRDQAVEVRPVSLDPVDERQVFAEHVDDAALLGEGRDRNEHFSRLIYGDIDLPGTSTS